MISIEVIALVLTGMSIAASITYYSIMIRNQNKAKERELVNQRISTLTPEFYRNWRKIMLGDWRTATEHLNYINENPDDQDGFNFLAVTFNSVARAFSTMFVNPKHRMIWSSGNISDVKTS